MNGFFGVRRVDVVGGEEQIVSTGLPLEALGRMSLDETDPGDRSFSEPQESSEDDLGMAFSPGKMVDDIVGEDNQSGRAPIDKDEEEIIFSGRAARKQLYSTHTFMLTFSRSNPVVNHNVPSPILLPQPHAKTPSPMPSPISGPPEQQPSQPKTVADLMMQAFPNRLSSPSQSPRTLSPHVQAIPASSQVEDQYNSIRPSPRTTLHHYEDGRRREESAVGVIGQGRASPRRADIGESPRWSGGFAGL